MPFVEFVGMVRKGEEEDILKGRRNWPREGVYNYIDLWFMSRLYRSFNLVYFYQNNRLIAVQHT